MQQRGKVRLSFALAAFYGLGLLAWPFAAFASVFMFDSPHVESSPWFPLLLYVAFSIFFYPGYWLLGAYLGWRSARRDQPVWRVLLFGSVPLLSALWLGGVPMLVGLGMEQLKQEHPKRGLYWPVIYDLGDQRLAIENQRNHFLDFPPKDGPLGGASAWVIDLKTDRPDKNGVITLGPNNLDREFFKTHDRKQLNRVPGSGVGGPPADHVGNYSAHYNWNRQSGVLLKTPGGEIFLRVDQQAVIPGEWHEADRKG